MKTGLKGCLITGFVLIGSAAETSPVLTIHVTNQAEVNRNTLFQAERTATAIFKKTGVATQWIDPPDEESFPLSHIHLKILPSVMSIRPGLPDNFRDNAIGLAPGSGPNRQWALVFYNSVEALAMSHRSDAHANTAKMLGHAIAHEIGHLLLDEQTHSAAGIMRGDWNLSDLRNASYGSLLFTPRQAKAIRQEASRRIIVSLPESHIAPN